MNKNLTNAGPANRSLILIRRAIQGVVVLAAWLCVGIGSAAAQPVRFVDNDAPLGGDGSSWATAYANLQDALTDAAASGGVVTEIWVAVGTYTPPGPGGDRAATFQLLSGVALYGGFVGTETLVSQRDPQANVAILSGDLDGNDGPNFANNSENSFHVVTGSGTNATAVLDGFTFTGGNANDPFPATDIEIALCSMTYPETGVQICAS